MFWEVKPDLLVAFWSFTLPLSNAASAHHPYKVTICVISRPRPCTCLTKKLLQRLVNLSWTVGHGRMATWISGSHPAVRLEGGSLPNINQHPSSTTTVSELFTHCPWSIWTSASYIWPIPSSSSFPLSLSALSPSLLLPPSVHL